MLEPNGSSAVIVSAPPLSDQVATARAAMPGTELRAVRPAPTPTDTTQVIFEAPDLPESHYRTVFIDPHTAEIRGILHTYGSSQALPMRAWIDNLHRQLLLGEDPRVGERQGEALGTGGRDDVGRVAGEHEPAGVIGSCTKLRL